MDKPPLDLNEARALADSLTVDQVHDFLRSRYKHDRFEGRNDYVWGLDYSLVVATSHLENVRKRGYGMISVHESVTGSSVIYDGSLSIRDQAFFMAVMKAEQGEKRALVMPGHQPMA